MTIFGLDAGFCAPGLAIVHWPTTGWGTPTAAECFIPKQLKDTSKTCNDVHRISQIALKLDLYITNYCPDVIVVELPTGGARSAAAIKGMAFTTGSTAAALAIILDHRKRAGEKVPELVYITPNQNKKGSLNLPKLPTGDEKVDKWDILRAVDAIWPGHIAWPKKKNGKMDDAKCWAIADALSCVATYIRPKLKLPESAAGHLAPAAPGAKC
jgi:hypothetical protein